MTAFGRRTLPYGVYTTPQDSRPRLGVAVQDSAVDLAALVGGALGPQVAATLRAPDLSALLASGPAAWRTLRRWLLDRLSAEVPPALCTPLAATRARLPFAVADYVDFYASLHHATNVGRLFRPDGDPLPAAWRHLPIGYHGRAGTVVVSGTAVRRPSGHRLVDGVVRVGPSLRLDIECEVGAVVGAPSRPGEPVPVDDAAEHLFGLVLLNDWSARDLQSLEYVPLGPLLGKSFATSISAWVVPWQAVEPARIAGPVQHPAPAPHLRGRQPWGLDLELCVSWNDTVVARPPFASMYWTFAQQIAHLTSNGAHLRTGDLLGSGTVSGPEPHQRGSFLELSWDGRQRLTLDDGQERTFLLDGDTVTVTGRAADVVLGPVTGTVLPAATMLA